MGERHCTHRVIAHRECIMDTLERLLKLRESMDRIGAECSDKNDGYCMMKPSDLSNVFNEIIQEILLKMTELRKNE
jgi:hypothetical protein